MKIGVYAICKNEDKNIQPWFESCVEADVITVTDTGSTDNSIHVLNHIQGRVNCEHLQIHHASILPWRFDDAMNLALNLLPADVDVAIRLDLDERLQPGWRAGIEQVWTNKTTKLRYPYVWNWNEDGTPGFIFNSDRIHARVGYRWSGVTHEGLKYRGSKPEAEKHTQLVKIHQYPDRTKTRPNDLPLLEEAVRETPTDARLWAYLGREYMWHRRYEDCERVCLQYVTMPGSGREERMAAYTHLAIAVPSKALYYLMLAVGEAPEFREPWVAMMTIHYNEKNWADCYKAARAALAITERPMHYVVLPQSWGSYPHDICAVAAFRLGLKTVAIEQAQLAIAKDPQDARLQTNLDLIRAA